jgi:hypothetical protein
MTNFSTPGGREIMRRNGYQKKMDQWIAFEKKYNEDIKPAGKCRLLYALELLDGLIAEQAFYGANYTVVQTPSPQEVAAKDTLIVNNVDIKKVEEEDDEEGENEGEGEAAPESKGDTTAASGASSKGTKKGAKPAGKGMGAPGVFFIAFTILLAVGAGVYFFVLQKQN